ncbi:MAG: FGGY family carbohydrate kinase [Rhizorhabdus sp.]
MQQSAILALDQGTTNTKALLVSLDGIILTRASRPMQLSHPQPGWAEQSADAIWASVQEVIADAVTGIDATVVALAVSNQRETIILWDAESGRPLAPAISWQCRRSSDRCAALREQGHEAAIKARTGLDLDPLFPATKLAWLLDNVPLARQRMKDGMLRAGTVDSWLLWNLTGGSVHATDSGNASRTQLYDLGTAAWSQDLGSLFGVPLDILPEVRASDSHFGDTATLRTALPGGIPILAMMGDSHAALFGHRLSGRGVAKVTIGTGSSIMALTDTPIQSYHGLSSTIAWQRGDAIAYALEGNITVSGQAAAFAAQLLGLEDANALSALAETVPDSGGVAFVPALAGLGAPHWDDRARGLIAGMTLGTRPAHVARATLEAIALQIVDVATAMEGDTGRRMAAVSVDGGATRNGFLVQLIADLLDRPIIRRINPELSALGAARMAAETLNFSQWTVEGGAEQRFIPTMSAVERNRIVSNWQAAVRLAKTPS